MSSILRAIQPAEGGRTILDPATGEAVGRVAEPGVAELDAAIVAAREAQPEWAALGDAERVNLLNLAADAIDTHAEELAQLLSREQGKPLNGAGARYEVGACSAWLRATTGIELTTEVLVDDGKTYAEMHHRPFGVVGAIGPWNWPMLISIWQLAPALRMGNTVVMKPSEYTPLSVLALVHVINKVLPPEVLTVVPGGRDVGEALSTHDDIDKVMFTGSTATGKAIIRSAADSVKRVTVELGGNDAGIVLDDVDPAAIAKKLFWGAFINTGQTCAALKRLYVPESLYEQVCDALVDVAASMPMGNGLDEANVLGPLQNQKQYDIVASLVEQARAGGGRVLVGGDPDQSAPGFFYPLTLVADLPADNPLVTQEQFGPVLPILSYKTLDEAIEQANSLDVGLGSSVWTTSPDKAREVALRLEAGTVWVNDHGAIDPRIPFGGAKQSGFGLEFAKVGLLECAQPVAIKGATGSFTAAPD